MFRYAPPRVERIAVACIPSATARFLSVSYSQPMRHAITRTAHIRARLNKAAHGVFWLMR
jgi:hypothetical protein